MIQARYHNGMDKTSVHSLHEGDTGMRPGEIAPAEALRRQKSGALLIDVREDVERLAGMPEGAVGMPCGRLEADLPGLEPDKSRDIVLVCAVGARSFDALETLRKLGYRQAGSMAGGFTRWRAERLPVALPDSLDADSAERYSRQILLPNVGLEGQRKLSEARVVMLGAGGLGAPASLYLAGAGIGHLTIIDHDHVDRSNLHRQVVHTDERVGTPKVEAARATLTALNPRINVQIHRERLVADNVEALLSDHDIIFDGADNFPVRYLLSAASVRLGLPMVYGAVERFTGQVSVFDPRREDSPCYRCLFPEPPAAEDAPNCSEAGVLSVLPGTIGMLQATEVLKLILGIGTPLTGRLLMYDALAMRSRELKLPRDPDCPGCGPRSKFSGYEDIEAFCAA